jgi:hypothetical protein
VYKEKTMWRKGILGTGLVLALFLSAVAVYAQGAEPQHSDPFWQAAYWNNISLSGDPAREETVDQINFDWGYGSPHHTVAAEGFSARWRRYLDLPADTYRFTATSDDGIRVYVDGQVIIDQWRDQPAQTYVADVSLRAGHHLVVVEYYENTGAAVAKLSWAPLSTPTGAWRGQYYGNRSLSGLPVLTRQDASIAFDWGAGSPSPGLPSDNFSVRWSSTFPLQAGSYRFTATSDDGVRVYVDQRVIIDEWHDHPPRSYSADLSLAQGPHEIVVEYYEHTGGATAKFEWTLLSPGLGEWLGEYYSNPWLNGAPALTRADESIDFNWGYGAPAAGLPSEGFSVRWTRALPLESGMYRFTTTTDDGVRLWVDGHLLIDAWHDQASLSHEGVIHLSGDVLIVMHYYENGGAASARLTWTRIDDEPPPAGNEVIVEDGAPGFRQGGTATSWRTVDGGHGGRYLWTRNNDRWRPDYNWAHWYPDLEPGRYEVYAYIPEANATTENARYWIAHWDGFSRQIVNQAANRGRWVSLGTYRFRGRGVEYVSLSDITYEPYLSTHITFDAVKWVPR